MPARERRKLTDAAIAGLRPRAREYTVWDSRAPGLGVRVRPTGGKSYVALVEAGGRSKRVALGPVSTRSIEEARAECHERRANRRERLTRFLSREEIARLHATLDEHEGRRSQAQADIIRLLLLTGCRRNEILHLRRSEVRGDMLFLEDGKTGSRKVPLNAQARRILERQPGTESPYVFPSPLDPNRPCSENLPLWYRIRREAGIEDCRLHDLRHTHASQVVMSGIPVPVVSRLLGHSNVEMTMRYAHLGDREIEKAAERIGNHLAELMGL